MRKVMFFVMSLVTAIVLSTNAMATTVAVGVATLGVGGVSNTGVSAKVGFPVWEGDNANTSFNVVGESYSYTIFGTNISNTLIGANMEFSGGLTGADEENPNFENTLNKIMAFYINAGYSFYNANAVILGTPINTSMGAFTYGLGIQAPKDWVTYYSIGYRGVSLGQTSMGGVVADIGIRF